MTPTERENEELADDIISHVGSTPHQHAMAMLCGKKELMKKMIIEALNAKDSEKKALIEENAKLKEERSELVINIARNKENRERLEAEVARLKEALKKLDRYDLGSHSNIFLNNIIKEALHP